MKILKQFLVCTATLLALCGCSGADFLNATIPSDGYTVTRDIAYGTDPRQKLDIYVPDVLADKQPVMVFFYGGRWEQGSKNDYRFAGQAFASKGFVTVIADYRLYPQVKFPSFLNDCAEAVVWAHQHVAEYGGNPKNLFVAGHSAGAYNTIMIATNDAYIHKAGGHLSWMRGAIGLAGPYDFLPLTDSDLIDMFGGNMNKATMPITFVKPGLPPMLLLTGADDTDVMPRNTHAMAAKLRANGDNVETRLYPDLAHIGIVLSLASGFRDKAPTLEDITSFVTAHSAP